MGNLNSEWLVLKALYEVFIKITGGRRNVIWPGLPIEELLTVIPDREVLIPALELLQEKGYVDLERALAPNPAFGITGARITESGVTYYEQA